MKVLLVSQEYPPCVGGAGIVARQTAEGLAASGNEVTVVTRHWAVSKPRHSDLKFCQAGGIKALWPFFMAKAIRSLNIKAYESIIINDIGAALVFGTFFNEPSLLKKTVVYLHGNEPASLFQNPKGFVRWSNFRPRYINLVKQCKSIIAVSNFMKSEFLQHCPLKLPEEKVKVVYAGVDNTLFRPIFSSLRADHSIANSSTILLSVSRINSEKGYAAMLDIFAELISRNNDVHWVIVGEGKYRIELEKAIFDKNLHKNVTLIGAVTRDKLPYFYSGADVFWLLSQAESFGLVYVEAQLCGCPAIGPDIMGVSEAIGNGVSGYLIKDRKDCLEWIEQRQFTKLNPLRISAYANRFALPTQLNILKHLL